MLLQKEGLPEEEELVIGTVTSVQFHSVFVTLDEYKNKTGMIHISEVSPGRIRNIRDFVREGKKVVCKVLRIHLDKGHIDLSLRRVNEKQRRMKNEEIKQEQKAENIITFVSEKIKKDPKQIFTVIYEKSREHYPSISACFTAVVDTGVSLATLGIDPSLAHDLEEIIRQRIKPTEVVIGGNLLLQSYAPEGIEQIKKILLEVEEKSPLLEVKYLGAGKYFVHITAKDYKSAEKILKDATDHAAHLMDSYGGICNFERIDVNKISAS